MGIILHEFEGRCALTRTENVIDFRTIGKQLFLIDKSGKIIKPNKNYKITIELLPEEIKE